MPNVVSSGRQRAEGRWHVLPPQSCDTSPEALCSTCPTHCRPGHSVVPGVPPEEVPGLVAVLSKAPARLEPSSLQAAPSCSVLVCQHPIELVRSANVCGSRLGGCCIVLPSTVNLQDW